MRILITGWAGFIGSHLVDACVARWYTVAIIDNCSTGSRDNIHEHLEKGSAQFFEGDICDKGFVDNVFQETKPDAVFHLAAHISVRESLKDPKYDTDINIGGTLVILEAMRKHGCKKIIFSSSGWLLYFGAPPFYETDVPNPKNPYSIAKYTCEMLLNFYMEEYWFQATALRYANVYGPRQNALGEAGVVTIFTDKIKKNEIPTIFSDGKQTRDFIHVSDVVAANLHAFDRGLTGAYHVGTGKETSVLELWNALAKRYSSSLAPQFSPSLGELQRSALDSSKLQTTGWVIRHPEIFID